MARFFVLVLFSVVFLSAQFSVAVAAPCARSNEKQALDVRVLQSELMVAALSCGAQDAYNEFAQKYSAELQRYGGALRSYFHRAYSGGGKYHMNRFVTQLANEASSRSMDGGSKRYCRAIGHLFSDLLDARGEPLHSFTSSRSLQLQHGIDSCKAVQSASQ